MCPSPKPNTKAMRNSVYTIGNLIMSVMGHICECGLSERMIEKRKQIVIYKCVCGTGQNRELRKE